MRHVRLMTANVSGQAFSDREETTAIANSALHHMLGHAPISMCIVANGTILNANAALERLLGKSAGELMGRSLDSLACRLETKIAGDGSLRAVNHASGQPIWVRVRAGDADSRGRAIWTFEDCSEVQSLRQELTRARARINSEVGRRTVRVRETNLEYRKELKRLRVFDVGLTQSREKYRVLFQNSQTGIAFVDDSGVISQTNPALRSMLRVRNMVEFRRIAQRPVCRVDGQERPAALAELARHLVQDLLGEQALLLVVEMPERESRYIEMRCVRMHVRDYSAALTFTDRTEEFDTLRRDAEQRRQMNRMGRISLAEHLGSAAAHELGQPLHVCMSYIGGLNQRLDSGDVAPSQIRHALSKIESELGRATLVVKNMRRFVANHQPEDQVVCLKDLLESTLDMMSSNFRDSKASVYTEIEQNTKLTFCGNAIEIQQVLVNIILNSLDAMRDMPGERSDIFFSLSVVDGDKIDCRIRDTGPGIPEDIYDKLFTPYCTSKSDGLGLGLAMSRNIVESHGGKVWAEKTQGRGAAFRFTLPTAGGHCQ